MASETMRSGIIAGESFTCINRADIEVEDEKELDDRGRLHVGRPHANRRVKFFVMRD